MGVINKQARLKALYRQELLNKIHCKECVNGNEKKSPDFCGGCAIYDQLHEIGEVLNGTVRERAKEVS